ncbi:MAG: hypothetical protein LBI42_06100 [Chitinispirillales bacterium]|jgi:hypothetical protein|nr:hypothetical protein [Chitinispirillales bacterium]
MRLNKQSLILATLVVSMFSMSVFAQKMMVPRKDGTSIYANEVREPYEQPVTRVGQNDMLTILETKRNHFRVRTQMGDEGFVEKKELRDPPKSSASQRMVFEGADVIGYLDNPTPVYIIDMDDPNADPITLDRSFKDALRENVDKETMERLAR